MSLSPSRRAALVTWAATNDAVIVEDDYDGELRYDRRPLRAVQAQDPARVVSCGSASKSLAPGLPLRPRPPRHRPRRLPRPDLTGARRLLPSLDPT